MVVVIVGGVEAVAPGGGPGGGLDESAVAIRAVPGDGYHRQPPPYHLKQTKHSLVTFYRKILYFESSGNDPKLDTTCKAAAVVHATFYIS